ncbi:MAG TPA: hypothetical protein VNK04_13660, partial [Gemmataceae bacterium]|nr:hypothetical protein [Gemmataceae bacterium]
MDSPWPAAAGAGEQARRGRRPRRSDGLESADLAISYDGERLEALEVRRGSLTADFDLFAVHTDPQSATIRVG